MANNDKMATNKMADVMTRLQKSDKMAVKGDNPPINFLVTNER